ncbi:hypothetical protein GOODEAATRI_034651 [Goodea atripinnis]|uniref:Uncharacterized protein n=1 Tax=Goodea atripinnis TaxID=208336 RepID=A0ABV0N6J6_9TELE
MSLSVTLEIKFEVFSLQQCTETSFQQCASFLLLLSVTTVWRKKSSATAVAFLFALCVFGYNDDVDIMAFVGSFSSSLRNEGSFHTQCSKVPSIKSRRPH